MYVEHTRNVRRKYILYRLLYVKIERVPKIKAVISHVRVCVSMHAYDN